MVPGADPQAADDPVKAARKAAQAAARDDADALAGAEVDLDRQVLAALEAEKEAAGATG